MTKTWNELPSVRGRSPWRWVWGAILPILMAGSACLPDARTPSGQGWAVQSDLPITRVVLYRNGVGYFERRGRVRGNLLHLRIRHDQVMDVLKSLTVVDTRSGNTVTVSLPAERSRVLSMSQLPPQVRRSGGLLAIAAAFRGARAMVRTDLGTWRGRLVGVENLGTSEKPDWRITLLAGGTLSAHRVAEIRSLRVLDKTLTVGLAKSLDVALSKGRWKPVRLAVRLSGKGPHDLVVSYVVPMPTWKPAYRLVMGDKGDKDVLLQGWAVVDNLSGEAWVRARLSLTAGTPLAFRYDLYTPQVVRRPDLTPRRIRVAEAPPPAEDATAGSRPQSSPPPAAKKAMPRGGGGMSGRSRGNRRYWRRHRRSRHRRPGAPSRSRIGDLRLGTRGLAREKEKAVSRKWLERSYRSLVSGRSVGSLFRYDVQQPVTLPNRSTSLVSLISRRVPGADVFYYIVGSGRANPYRAVRFRNASGFVLERGPVTIYRGGAFVGEALGGRVERGAAAFVPYAVEGRVLVHLSSSVKDEGLRLMTIRSGYLTIQSQSITRYTYKVTDRTGEGLALWVARRRRSGWKVIWPKRVTLEKHRYYTRIPLKAKGVTTFTVKEATPVRRTLTIFDSRARRAVAIYLKGSDVPPKLRKSLAKVLALQEQVAKVEIQMQTLRQSIAMLRRRQADIRQNVKALGKRGNRDLRRRLLGNLATVETQLVKLNRGWVLKNMKRGALRQRLRILVKMVRL